MSRKQTREYGPAAGAAMMKGLTEAAKLFQAEEKIKAEQLKLFHNLKSEGQKVQ